MEFIGSIINDFVEENVKEHMEPQRKGTPKGDSIGFSLKKNKAALLSLTYFKQSTIAETMGVSHALIRKWHTEDDFLRTIDKLCKEFADRYLDIILEEKGFRRKINEYLDKQDEGIDALPDIFQVHRHNDFYGFRLRGPLIGRLLKQAQESTDIVRIIGALSAIACLLNPQKLIKIRKKLYIQKNLSMQPHEIKNLARLICTQEIRSSLLGPSFTDSERKVSLLLLKIIEELDP